jgi:hypothetical protein
MKSIVFTIINDALYNSKISDVDVSGLRSTTNSFNGQVKLMTTNNEVLNFEGNFDVFDFLKEYGFVIHSKLFLKP